MKHILIRIIAMVWVLVPFWSIAAEDLIQLEVGHQRLHREPLPISRVTVGRPEIADLVADGKLLASMLTKGEVLLTGTSVGSTSLNVWLKNVAEPRSYRIVVTTATALATQGLGEGNGELQVHQAGSMLRLTGNVSELSQHATAVQAAAAAGSGSGATGKLSDASVLNLDTMVQTDIRIVEVSRRALKELGFNFIKNLGNTSVAISPPSLLSGIEVGSGGTTFTSQGGFLPIAGAFNLAYGNAGKGLLANLSALEANGLAYTLAEPSLVALSGQTATFLAGGEFPIPVAQSGGTQTSITVEFKEFGVRLALTPTVLSSNHIALKVAPEVSELDFNTTVQTASVTIPGLKVRRADTTIELGDGDSFVISGLVSSNMVNNVDKIPWLGDIPLLGTFFRSTRFDREDKELVMIVTPHLVRPLASGSRLPPLPGAEYQRYHPDAFRALVEERGNFVGNPPLTGYAD